MQTRKPLGPFPNGASAGTNCIPLTGVYPLVKENPESARKKRAPEANSMEPIKRIKQEPSAFAVDELLGRSNSQAGPPPAAQRYASAPAAPPRGMATANPHHAPLPASFSGAAAAVAGGGGGGAAAAAVPGRAGPLTTFGDIASVNSLMGPSTNQEGMDAAKQRLLSRNYGDPSTSACSHTHTHTRTHSHCGAATDSPLATLSSLTQGMDAAKQRLLSRNYSDPSTNAAGAAGCVGVPLHLQPAGSLGLQPSTSGRANSGNLGVAPSGLAQVQPHPHDFHLPCSQNWVPYDWALKRLWRITAPHRISALDAAHASGSKVGSSLAGASWHSLSPKEQWAQSLQSWRFPESPLDADAIAALSTGKPGAVRALSQRLESWRTAFSSAYMALRQGHSCGLYVIYPEVPRSPSASSFLPASASSTSEAACSTVILFTAGGTRSNSQPQAMVSQSTSLMRARMASAGLRFSMPLAPPTQHGTAHAQRQQPSHADIYGDADAEELQAHLPEQQQQQQQQGGVFDGKEGGLQRGGGAGSVARDNTPGSMLLFSGGPAVHALADYLLEVQGFRGLQQGGFTEGHVDVPVLLAPVHFEGASIHRPLVKSLGTMAAPPSLPPRPNEQQQQQPPQQQQPHLQGSQVVEVAGPLPPWSLSRACAALQASQQPCQLDLTSYATCITLNCCPLQPHLHDLLRQHHHHQQHQHDHQYQQGLREDGRHCSCAAAVKNGGLGAGCGAGAGAQGGLSFTFPCAAPQCAVVPHERHAMQCMCPHLHHRVLRSVRLEGMGASDGSAGAGVYALRATGGGGPS